MSRLWSCQLILSLIVQLSGTLPVMAIAKSVDSPLALSRQCVVVVTEGAVAQMPFRESVKKSGVKRHERETAGTNRGRRSRDRR